MKMAKNGLDDQGIENAGSLSSLILDVAQDRFGAGAVISTASFLTVL